MNFVNMLDAKNIDPNKVLVLRHRPKKLEFRKKLPWLAANKPDVFNAYQQTQGEKVEKRIQALEGTGHVASFVAHGAKRALFVGLYHVRGGQPVTAEELRAKPAGQELLELWDETPNWRRKSLRWFDLVLTDFYADWKGKLIVGWPPPDINWFRIAGKSGNTMPVLTVHTDSQFLERMPPWNRLVLTWSELHNLPTDWQSKLSECRGIYYILDTSDGKGYVGSASGKDNLLGRWLNYAATGHGDNKRLLSRDPSNFRFSIL